MAGEYSNLLNVGTSHNSVWKVNDFIKILSILQFDGSSMKMVNVNEILDFVDNGTTETLLAMAVHL